MSRRRRGSPRTSWWRPLASTAVALALTVAAAPAGAQKLGELYDAARRYDATFLAARALVDAARYRVAQARGATLPTLGLQLGAQRSLSDTPDQTTLDSAARQVSASLSASQPLFNRVNDIAVAQAEKAEALAGADYDTAEQDLIVRVAQAYFDVLAAEDTLATAEGSLKALSEQLASAQRSFEVGSATIIDTREAQARVDLARATQVQAEATQITSRIALDTLVGRAGVAPAPLARPVVPVGSDPPTADGWVAQADAEHPLVRRARLSLDVARLETDKAKAGHLPTAALTASYARGYQSTYGNVPQSGFPSGLAFAQRGSVTSSSIGVTITIPLFAGFQVQNRIKETLVLEDKSQDDLQAQRRAVAQATRTAFYGLRSAVAQADALEAAERSSVLALESTRLGYQVGVRVTLDVLNAQAQVSTTEAQLAKARYDVVMGGLRLRQAAGRVSGDDVMAIDRSLRE